MPTGNCSRRETSHVLVIFLFSYFLTAKIKTQFPANIKIVEKVNHGFSNGPNIINTAPKATINAPPIKTNTDLRFSFILHPSSGLIISNSYFYFTTFDKNFDLFYHNNY